MAEHRMKPIWYFVGLMLTVMGALILFSGIYQSMNPPPVKTVLAETRPGIWWGTVMVACGSLMYWKSRKEPS